MGRTETCCTKDSPRTLRESAGTAHRQVPTGRAWELAAAGMRDPVFLFFSNRLGCLGSLLVSALVTLVILALLGVL